VRVRPTDQDRLIVNKATYPTRDPGIGDIVMMHDPLNPDKVFVKRVIAEEGDQIRIVRLKQTHGRNAGEVET